MWGKREVRSRLKELGIGRFQAGGAAAYLTHVLSPDEPIAGAVAGSYDYQPGWFYKHSRSGLLIATDRRVLFVSKGWVRPATVEEFRLSAISSFEHKKGFIFGRIVIHGSGNRAQISMVERRLLPKFMKAMEDLRAPVQGVSVSPRAEQRSVADDLAALAGLRDSGALTKAEFEVAKGRLLTR